MRSRAGTRPPIFEGISDEPRVRVQWFDRQHERARVGPHGQHSLELLYFEQGGGRHRIGRRAWEVRAGDLYLIAPGEIHDVSELDEATGWAVEFAADAVGSAEGGDGVPLLWHANPLLYPFVRRVAGEVGHLSVPEEARPAWSHRLRAMDAELGARDAGFRAAVRAHLTLLLIGVARLAADIVGQLRGRGDPLLVDVFDFIDRHYAEPISLSDVANGLGLSAGYLTTAVKRRTGRNVLAWIAERRLTEARRLLVATDESVERIASLVGYRDPTYFIRSFKRTHGATPAAWRRANR